MYILDQVAKNLRKIESKTFHRLGFKERDDLQEWIANCPNCLGEELLIIQKEFNGFNDTNERLDLLALDKNGALVVIENKLDDTGKDVMWQAIKYVSYCSTLSKQQIKEIYKEYLDKKGLAQDAEENIVDFFDGRGFDELSLNENDQRIILIAGNFRKEVTATVMWLLSHGIRVQCFKITPYEHNEDIIVDLEQIIPVKEAEEYIIKIADKVREEKEVKEINNATRELRKTFWLELLEEFNKVSNLYKNISPTYDSWLSSGSGVSGAPFSFAVTKTYASVEVVINKGEKEENKRIFDALYVDRECIEEAYGKVLIWERLDHRKSSRIANRLFGVNINNKEDWPQIKEFLCAEMIKFEKAIREKLKKAANSK